MPDLFPLRPSELWLLYCVTTDRYLQASDDHGNPLLTFTSEADAAAHLASYDPFFMGGVDARPVLVYFETTKNRETVNG